SQQYAMRYNMIALLNLVSEAKEDADNDGFAQPSEAATITQKQVTELVRLCDETKTDKAKFCALFNVDSIAAIPPGMFLEAKSALTMKKRVQSQDFPGDR